MSATAMNRNFVGVARSAGRRGVGKILLPLLTLAILGGWVPTVQAYIPFTGAASIFAGSGSYHSCAIVGGALKCWGENSGGQIGDGSVSPAATPVQVSGLTSGVTAAAVGNSHTCALQSGGVKCWGNNSTGQVGDGSLTQRLTPVAVTGLASGVSAVVAGAAHSCALTTGGGVKCWGANSAGQLGDNSTTQRPTPVNVSGLTSGVVAITAGQFHTCAVTTAGVVKCWGSNASGQLGDNSIATRLTPVNVVGNRERSHRSGGRQLAHVRACRRRREVLGFECQRAARRQQPNAAPHAGRRRRPRQWRDGDRDGFRAHVRAAHRDGTPVLGRQHSCGARRWHRRGTTAYAGRRHGPDQRRHDVRGRQPAHVRADGGRCRELLGRRQCKSARRHRVTATARARPCGRSAISEGDVGRGVAHVRHRRRRRGQVLGCQRQRPARRQLRRAAHGARRGQRARGGRGGDRHRRDALLRADGRRRSQVLGGQHKRPARRQHDDATADADYGAWLGRRRARDRGRRQPHVRAHERRWRQVLGPEQHGPARRRYDDRPEYVRST